MIPKLVSCYWVSFSFLLKQNNYWYACKAICILQNWNAYRENNTGFVHACFKLSSCSSYRQNQDRSHFSHFCYQNVFLGKMSVKVSQPTIHSRWNRLGTACILPKWSEIISKSSLNDRQNIHNMHLTLIVILAQVSDALNVLMISPHNHCRWLYFGHQARWFGRWRSFPMPNWGCGWNRSN